MESIQVSRSAAMKIYGGTNTDGKKAIIELLGDKFISGKITDRIKTFEDACEDLGVGAADYHISTGCQVMDKDKVSIQAYSKLIIIARALNEGWTPDWKDSGQIKYVPYFILKPGVGFSYDDCDDWRTVTTVGSRLCYKSHELAEYAATQFQSLYNEFLNQ